MQATRYGDDVKLYRDIRWHVSDVERREGITIDGLSHNHSLETNQGLVSKFCSQILKNRKK